MIYVTKYLEAITEGGTTELCRLAAWYGLDKTPLRGHAYTPFYHRTFAHRRMEVRKVLEIGIDRGWSLFLWRQYFPNAQVYALDVNPERMVNIERIQSRVCDQSDEVDLREAAKWAGDGFDFICDDGSHEPWHQIITARYFYPLLAPSGVYVIEDVLDPNVILHALPAKPEVHRFNLARDPYDSIVVLHGGQP